MSRRAARVAVLLVDEVRERLSDRGVAPPAAGVIFDEVWPLAKELAGRERWLELASDWQAGLSADAQACLDEGLAAVTTRLAPPALRHVAFPLIRLFRAVDRARPRW